jgi:hypothetical protein
VFELVARERLSFQQHVGAAIEQVAVDDQEIRRLFEGGVDDRAHGLVDLSRGVVAVGRARGHGAEMLRTRVREAYVAELGHHGEARHHLPGDLRRARQVVGGPRREVSEDELLRRASAHQDRQSCLQVFPRLELPFAFRALEREAEGAHVPGNDRDLGDRIGVRERGRDEGVPSKTTSPAPSSAATPGSTG